MVLPASAAMGPITTARLARTTPAFSRAMAARVRPRYSSWSKSMLTIVDTRGEATLVASSRPPSPTSRTAMSTPVLAKVEEGHRGQDLEVIRMGGQDAPLQSAVSDGVVHFEDAVARTRRCRCSGRRR